MPLTPMEAQALGAAKLRISKSEFDAAMAVVKRGPVTARDAGALALAMAIMKRSGAYKAYDVSSELTDALTLIDRAEKEWRMERAVGKGRA